MVYGVALEKRLGRKILGGSNPPPSDYFPFETPSEIPCKRSLVLSHRNPLGYRDLRTWQQANEIFELTEVFITTLPARHPKTQESLADIKDHMQRSARSHVRNIEEGYARTSTREYISFLGFSAGSLEELIGDYKYCQKSGIGDPKGRSKGIGLCVGEAKMLDAQIKSLEAKCYREKTVSANDLARRVFQENRDREKRFDEWLKDQRG